MPVINGKEVCDGMGYFVPLDCESVPLEQALAQIALNGMRLFDMCQGLDGKGWFVSITDGFGHFGHGSGGNPRAALAAAFSDFYIGFESKARQWTGEGGLDGLPVGQITSKALEDMGL